MTETELKKLIEDCCNDIFYRLEPLANVKSRLYQTLKPAINYTHCCTELCDCEIPKPKDPYNEIDKHYCRDCENIIINGLEKKLTCDVCYTETINKKDEYDNIYCDDCKEL